MDMATTDNDSVGGDVFKQKSATEFTSHLDSDQQGRYQTKLQMLGVSDPYSVPGVLFRPLISANQQDLPDLQYPDIVNYLIFNLSPYTGETIKAYKSSSAYKYFQAGWVRDVMVWYVEGKGLCVVMAKVCTVEPL